MCSEKYHQTPTMTQSTRGHHDDSTNSTTNRTRETNLLSPSPTLTKKNLAKAKRTQLFLLKFEYNVSQPNVNIAQLHGTVIKALISANGDDVTIYDKAGDAYITMTNFPRTQEEWTENFFMTTVKNEKNVKAIIMVGHNVASSLSLSDLKHSIQPTLRATDCFVKINDWAEHLDSRTAGYLRNLHPIHHDRKIIHNAVAIFLASVTFDDSSSLPEFKIVPASTNESQSNKNLSSRFLAVTCKNKEDAQIIQKALLTAYSTLSTPIDVNLGSFIPASAKYTDKELFRKLIRRQNQYLAGHRNIPNGWHL
jgi:hypothetical protein